MQKIEKLGMAADAIGLVMDSVELGVTFAELSTSVGIMIDQGNDKGYFDTYGLQIISSMKMRMDGTYEVPRDMNALMQIASKEDGYKELERYRKALVTLTTFDEDIMISYKKMRAINDSNGFKFDYDLTWLTESQIDSRINVIRNYRRFFEARPAIYDSLFDE